MYVSIPRWYKENTQIYQSNNVDLACHHIPKWYKENTQILKIQNSFN